MGRSKEITSKQARKAATHPTRVRVVAAVLAAEADPGRRSAMSPNELAGELGVPLGVVAYHVRTLLECLVLKPMGTRQVRGATEHFYGVRASSRAAFREAVRESLEQAAAVVAAL